MQEPNPHFATHRFTLGEESTMGQFDDPCLWENTIPKRFVGYLIDIVVLALISAFIWILAFLSLGLLSPLTALAQAILPLAYHTFMVSQRGATVGQSMAGIRIVSKLDGENPTILQAFVMTVLFYFSLSLAFVPFVFCLLDEKNRFLHDIFSGTRSLNADALEAAELAEPA